jgi:hypothetical protein
MLALVADLPPGFVPPYLKAEAARFGARLAAARGDEESATRGFAEAQAALDALGYRYWSARCRLDRAEWLVERDRPAAVLLAEEAAVVFEELSAPHWARRARALTSESVSV